MIDQPLRILNLVEAAALLGYMHIILPDTSLASQTT